MLRVFPDYVYVLCREHAQVVAQQDTQQDGWVDLYSLLSQVRGHQRDWVECAHSGRISIFKGGETPSESTWCPECGETSREV